MADFPICGLNIFQWNCNGLAAHSNELKQHLAESSYDVICLQETFLKPNRNFELAGYSIVRKDRIITKKGGLITLVKDSLIYTEVSVPDDIECISVKINTDNSHLTVANLYIRPNQEIDKHIFSTIFQPKSIIVGDLNSKNKLWGSPINDPRGSLIENLIDETNFVVLNNGQPTYTHHTGSQSHIDLSIAHHSLATKCDWEVLDDTLGSDHSPTVTRISVNPIEVIDDSLYFKMSKADWESFQNNARKLLTPDSILDSVPVNENSELLTSTIIKIAELSIPQGKKNRIKRSKPLPYWNQQCKKAVKDRNKARNTMHKNKTLDNCINYRHLKGKAQHVIKTSAREHWQEYCNSLDKSTKLVTVWRMAKKMNGVNSNHKIRSLSVNGANIVKNQDKAEVFAKTFSDISSNNNYSTNFQARKQDIELNHKHLFSDDPNLRNNENLESVNEPFDLHELRRALREVKKHSAPGADRISYEMLQKLPKCSIKAVLKLYNQVWINGDFPVSWRHSVVLPVLKPGKDPKNAASYRPISLTPTLCKIMEKLVTTRLTYFAEKNNILNNIQSGFRKGRSTIDHIIRLQDSINKYNNNKGYTVGVFIDFQSAFDMMWRSGLLMKLKGLGICGNVFSFIKNFLTDRSLQVKIDNTLSQKYTLDNGTAQGSIISPLLFLIMINDLPNSLQDVESSLFADDSCIFKSGKNLKHITKSIQKNLDKISSWCDLWGIKMSLDKTVAVVFSHRQNLDIELTINNQPLKIENKAKFLGLIFDSKLNWNEHVTYLEQKCNKRLNLMRAVAGNAWGANKKALLTIYRSLIRSVIDYGAIAYNSASDSTKKRLDIIQHKALRIACGSFGSTFAAAMQVETGEMPLDLRRSQQEIKYTVKVKATEGHPAKSVTEFHWTTLSKKFKHSNLPIYCKTSEYFSQTQNQQITAPVLSDQPPWHQKPCIVDTTLINSGNKHENPQWLKSLALEKIDSYKDSVHIYTDASKTINNKTSAAFCIPSLHIEHSARLTDNISIFTAELTAIKLALLWIINTLTEDVCIFSDSYSSLQAITSGKSVSRPNLLTDVLDLISKYHKTVKFIWLPSHIGIKGNELADRLANVATANSIIDLDIGLELSEAYNLVDRYIINKWQHRWDNEATGCHYRQIEKSASTKLKFSHPSRHHDVVITRLRLGKCCLNAYLHQINKHPNGMCDACNKPETVTHFLLECPHNATCSAVLAACSNLKISPSIDIVLSDSRIYSIILSTLNRKI